LPVPLFASGAAFWHDAKTARASNDIAAFAKPYPFIAFAPAPAGNIVPSQNPLPCERRSTEPEFLRKNTPNSARNRVKILLIASRIWDLPLMLELVEFENLVTYLVRTSRL